MIEPDISPVAATNYTSAAIPDEQPYQQSLSGNVQQVLDHSAILNVLQRNENNDVISSMLFKNSCISLSNILVVLPYQGIAPPSIS